MQPVIEGDPDYWTSQFNYQSNFQFDPQGPSLNQLLPNSNSFEDFPGVKEFLRPPDPATNFADNSHIDLATNFPDNSYVNPSFSVEPVLVTMQVGYHVSSDGSILPIFVSSIFA